MKDTSRVALDSIQNMLDFIRSNERQSQESKKYMVVFIAFNTISISKERFATKEEALNFAKGYYFLNYVVCQEGDYHAEEKLKSNCL